MTSLRARSVHGNASAESSITFPLVILPGFPCRHMALLMAESHDPPFRFCDQFHYMRKVTKKLLLFHSRRRRVKTACRKSLLFCEAVRNTCCPCRGRCPHRPGKCCEFAVDFRKISLFCRDDVGIVPYRQTSRFSARTGNNVFRQSQKTCLRHVFSVDRRRLCRRGQPQEASRENSRTSECCPGAECDIEWRRIQRLLNCGARRAAFKPYFFLSFILGSRVRKPAAFSVARNSGLTLRRARATP